MSKFKPNKDFTSELFDTKEDAEKAYNEAIKEGYTPEEINVLMSEESRKKYYGSHLTEKKVVGDKSMEGLAIGGALGGAITGTLAAIAALGTSLVFPGLGLIIGGPLAAGLAGVGAGSISGGLIGALIGWGIPEERVNLYEEHLKSGGIVLGVDERRTSDLRKKWEKYKSKKL